jgi:membrane dipeptidase
MMTQEEKRAAYYKTPQRLHVYESTDKAKEIVQKSMAIDTLFSGVVPIQWSTPQAPEFHDEMDKIKAAGFKTIGACTTADALGASFVETMKAFELYLAKFHERPDKYQLVRTAADIDKAIAEDKLGI